MLMATRFLVIMLLLAVMMLTTAPTNTTRVVVIRTPAVMIAIIVMKDNRYTNNKTKLMMTAEHLGVEGLGQPGAVHRPQPRVLPGRHGPAPGAGQQVRVLRPGR
eukprot:scaffold167537_cov21-Prasinocladus_malaysianus.AAC.1